MASGAKALKIGETSSNKVTPVHGGRWTLFKIDSAISEMVDALEFAVDETGQIVDEILEQKIRARLNSLKIQKEQKVIGVAVVIKTMLGQISLLEKERLQLARREKSLAHKVDWLTRYLVSHLQADPSRPGLKVSAIPASITWRFSESVEVVNPHRLPWRYQRASIADISDEELAKHWEVLRTLRGFRIDPKKDMLKKRIKAGIAKGKQYRRLAKLIERYSINIK